MEYRIMPGTGLKVSVIGYGHMMTVDTPEQQEKTNQIIKECWDLGINFFDNAELYGNGQAEVQFGKAFKALNVPREDAVITTKIFWTQQPSLKPNDIGLSRKHIIEGTQKCLKRLQLEYVDLLYCHRFDENTPLEETIRAMNHCIESGWALYWGTSEWSAAQIFEAFAICEKYNLIKPVVEQPQYNMFVREKMEKEFYRLFKHYGYGTTIWGPLCSGILTGKYNKGIPEDSRISMFSGQWPIFKMLHANYFGSQEITMKTVDQLNQLEQIAKEIGGASMAQLAVAWTLQNQHVTVTMTSSSKVGQVTETVGSLNFVSKITKSVDEQIDAILGSRPTSDMNMREYGPLPNTRDF